MGTLSGAVVPAAMRVARRLAAGAGLAVVLGVGAGVLSVPAWADDRGSAQSDARQGRGAAISASDRPVRRDARQAGAAADRLVRAAGADSPARAVTVNLPPMPRARGVSFEVSADAIAERARDTAAAGGDPTDAPRFFFGDLAVDSLDALAAPGVTPADQRVNLGNLAVSGYFGGVWLRDNLRALTPPVPPTPEAQAAAPPNVISALGIGLFDVLAAGLTQAAAVRNPRLVTAAAHVSVPVLLTLYGYNRGYLEFLLDNPPTGVTSMRESLSCNGFLNCSSDAFPLEMATRYDAALDNLAAPATGRWQEMAAWTTLLEGATGSGRLVWNLIAQAGAFSPTSYQALVELSSAYLMVSKAAALSAMTAYAEGDAATGRSSLRLQAGLWMWSGAYFGGLASTAPPGTILAVVLV